MHVAQYHVLDGGIDDTLQMIEDNVEVMRQEGHDTDDLKAILLRVIEGSRFCSITR